jgi:iron(III) transport system substrate-binding protein
MKRIWIGGLVLLIVGLLSGNWSAAAEVVVYTSEDQVFSEPVLKACEAKTGIAVKAVYDTEETKSTGVVNRLLAERTNPQADVFWSNDPVRPIVLHRKGILTAYRSPNRERIPPRYRDAEGYWTGFSARARVIICDRHLVTPESIPHSVLDLTAPPWKGQAALANPLFGTSTIHAAALFTIWGEGRAKTFFEQMKHNGVRIATSNGEVRDMVAGGEVAWGFADTDDAHVAVTEQKPVEVVYPDQDGVGTLIMPNMVVMIKGGPHPEPAKQLIDYLLSAEVEEQLALSPAAQMPLGPGVKTPERGPTLASVKGMDVDYVQVAEMLEKIQPFLSTWVGYR